MGSRRDCTWILGLPGFRVEMIEGQDEAATSRLRVLHGEVMGLRQDRTEDAARALLTEDLTGRQRAAITAVCTDMHRPYLNAVGEVVKDAEVVFDKFHVLQHASAGSTTCGGKNSFARAR